MTHYSDLPCAAKGFVSYRYKGPYGWIMIGAKNIQDALNEANISLSNGKATMENLQIWNDEIKMYEDAFIPISEQELVALIDEKLL